MPESARAVVTRAQGWGIMEIIYRLVAWGLLWLFAGFLAYGASIAAYTLFRFYRGQFAKLGAAKASKPLR